jgi:ATP/maltotriose-dependent transcriptional regulator MalT
LLHAEDWETIADLVEQQGEELIVHGRPGVVAAWIARLPAPVLDRRPHIAYLRGVLAIEQRDLERGRALLGQALAGLAASGDARLRGAALVALASCCSMMNDFAAAQTAAEQALSLPLANATRVQLLAVRAHLAMGRGEWPQTVAALDEALALAAALGDARTLGTLVAYFFVAYGVLPPDGAGRIERMCALIERLAQPHHSSGSVGRATARRCAV